MVLLYILGISTTDLTDLIGPAAILVEICSDKTGNSEDNSAAAADTAGEISIEDDDGNIINFEILAVRWEMSEEMLIKSIILIVKLAGAVFTEAKSFSDADLDKDFLLVSTDCKFFKVSDFFIS